MYSAALRERGKNTHSTELSSTELEVSSRLHAYVKKDLDFIVSYFAVRDQSLTVTGGHLGFRCSCHFEEDYLPKEWWSRTETNPCYSEHLITVILRRIRTCTRFKKEKEKKKKFNAGEGAALRRLHRTFRKRYVDSLFQSSAQGFIQIPRKVCGS